jgi:hypothetical protein
MRQWMTRGKDLVEGRTVTGGAAMVQRHEHMLETRPGDLVSDPEWGIGLRDYQGQTTAFTDADTLGQLFSAQHLRDPETASADVRVTINGAKLTYDGRFRGEDGLENNLALVIP